MVPTTPVHSIESIAVQTATAIPAKHLIQTIFCAYSTFMIDSPNIPPVRLAFSLLFFLPVE